MENKYYRDNLAAILEFTGGRHLLGYGDIYRYTGLKDHRAIRKRYPLNKDGTITAETLARRLCEGPDHELVFNRCARQPSAPGRPPNGYSAW